MKPSLLQKLQGWTEPSLLLTFGYLFFGLTLLDTVFIQWAPSRLLRVNDLRAKAFSRLWLYFAPAVVKSDKPATQAVADGAFAKLPELMEKASGDILELGPGSGAVLPYYKPSLVRTVCGAEPAVDLHQALRESAIAMDLGDKYKILACGAEKATLLPALHKAGLLESEAPKGVFDAIVCVRVLCGVPDLPSTVGTLYDLLRPGGRIIICEHVINPWRSAKGSIIGRGMQLVHQYLGWSFIMGDCELDRDTGNVIKSVGESKGGWESVDVEGLMEWSAIPFVTGTFEKKR